MGLRLMLLTGALGACSPFGGGAFECSLDNQCSGGTCSDGFCAFSDSECDSGLRYGELSGPRAGQCVGGSIMIDARPIDSPDGPDPDTGTGCYGTGLVSACFNTPPTGAVTLTGSINTGSSSMCDTDARNAAWCVIAGATVTVSGTVTVIGTKPLVLVATQTITNNGTLDVASHRVNGIVGAGGNAAGCSGTAPGTSGGGAGGSFGGSGGAGGGTNNAGTAGGVAGATTPNPTMLRGGCAGQNGNGGTAGVGGPGGGAVFLIAETSINNIGTINASGAGGTNGTNAISGAGGGGSGGFIGIDTPVCMNAGAIFANGGGGAEGSGQTTAGQVGNDPVGGAGGVAGAGLSTNGGDGGAGQGGATATAGTGANGTATGGGGGGGGGVGIIKTYRGAIGSGGIVSPNPT